MLVNSEVKKILVTGGAGYIGSVLVRKLLERGYQVRVLDKLIFGPQSLADVKDKIELVVGDIRRVAVAVLDDVDAVIHLAGFSTDPTSQYDPRLTDMVNHIATEKLAKVARQKGIKRFVYASSCSVYFTLTTPLEPPQYKETDIINPISAYSLAKRCSEQVLWGMTNEDFQPTILRKGTLYGLSPRMRYDLVFNSLVKDAYYKRVMTVDAGGAIWRPMIDIQDAVAAYIQCLELPLKRVGGKIFNVCDQNWSIGDLARYIQKTIRRKKGMKVNLDIKPFGQTRNYKADNTLFKKTFNFSPTRTMDDALFELWDYLKRHKKHDPDNIIYYSDSWYRRYFETKDGQKFRRHV